jgi:hypothetical protein
MEFYLYNTCLFFFQLLHAQQNLYALLVTDFYSKYGILFISVLEKNLNRNSSLHRSMFYSLFKVKKNKRSFFTISNTGRGRVADRIKYFSKR